MGAILPCGGLGEVQEGNVICPICNCQFKNRERNWCDRKLYCGLYCPFPFDITWLKYLNTYYLVALQHVLKALIPFVTNHHKRINMFLLLAPKTSNYRKSNALRVRNLQSGVQPMHCKMGLDSCFRFRLLRKPQLMTFYQLQAPQFGLM